MSINDIFWMWIIGSMVAVFWITINEEAQAMNRYGLHETPVQLDCEWATLDAVIHWELTCDDFRDVFEILKISIGSQDLREGWNIDYFESIIQDEIDNGDTEL